MQQVSSFTFFTPYLQILRKLEKSIFDIEHCIYKICVYVQYFTNMKSLPRPWYLTKWTYPLSLRSRKETEELFSGASIFIEDAAEIRKLGHCMPLPAANLRLFDCKVTGEENAETEERDRRRLGVMRGTVMAAAIAIEGVG